MRNSLEILTQFTYVHLGNAFIQSDLQLKQTLRAERSKGLDCRLDCRQVGFIYDIIR